MPLGRGSHLGTVCNLRDERDGKKYMIAEPVNGILIRGIPGRQTPGKRGANTRKWGHPILVGRRGDVTKPKKVGIGKAGWKNMGHLLGSALK